MNVIPRTDLPNYVRATVNRLARDFQDSAYDWLHDRNPRDALERMTLHAKALLHTVGETPDPFPQAGEAGSAEDMLQALMRRVTVVAVNLFAVDCHRWSTRPCPTCKPISDLLGEPFGCYWFAKLPKEQQNRDHGGNY